MIDSAEDLFLDAERVIDGAISRAYQASAVAMSLFLLTHVHGLGSSERVTKLRQRLDSAVRDAELDVLPNQVRYATSLAEAKGPLEYEELHKLFSLLDDIHALRQLGFTIDAHLIEDMEHAVRARFATQQRAARMAAEDRVEDWNRALWWYAELLGAAS
jgi:hypothetical protein